MYVSSKSSLFDSLHRFNRKVSPEKESLAVLIHALKLKNYLLRGYRRLTAKKTAFPVPPSTSHHVLSVTTWFVQFCACAEEIDLGVRKVWVAKQQDVAGCSDHHRPLVHCSWLCSGLAGRKDSRKGKMHCIAYICNSPAVFIMLLGFFNQ